MQESAKFQFGTVVSMRGRTLNRRARGHHFRCACMYFDPQTSGRRKKKLGNCRGLKSGMAGVVPGLHRPRAGGPFRKCEKQEESRKNILRALRDWLCAAVLLATSAWTLGCGGGGAGSVTPSSPPPPSITVTITPTSGAVLLGETLTFSAAVSNTTDTSVTWSVNRVSGGSSQAGTISADGVYTAPADLPSGGTVQVTATSHADSI